MKISLSTALPPSRPPLPVRLVVDTLHLQRLAESSRVYGTEKQKETWTESSPVQGLINKLWHTLLDNIYSVVFFFG